MNNTTNEIHNTNTVIRNPRGGGDFVALNVISDASSSSTSAEIGRRGIEKAAKEGDATAQYRIGVIYRKGFHVPQDKAKAFEWFRKAAEQGHVKAQYTLGIMLNKGEVGPRDYVEARKWFEKAAATGHTHAAYQLALLQFAGHGGPADKARAIDSFRTLAARNFYPAQYTLGYLMLKGDGMSADPAAAAAWFEKAAAANGRPYIYLRYTERNEDGSFPVGTRLPLRLFNAIGAAKIEWTYNGKVILPGDNGYFIPSASGILKATVYHEDGSADIITKRIIIRSEKI